MWHSETNRAQYNQRVCWTLRCELWSRNKKSIFTFRGRIIMNGKFVEANLRIWENKFWWLKMFCLWLIPTMISIAGVVISPRRDATPAIRTCVWSKFLLPTNWNLKNKSNLNLCLTQWFPKSAPRTTSGPQDLIKCLEIQ